jgi:undecaprenyl diphosphate synthase
MAETEELTVGNSRMRMVFCFNYGGRREIAEAVQNIAAEVASGELSVDDVGEAAIAGRLYLPDMPDPDVIIRTSGEQRLSNFLLWQSAYSEFVFTDMRWPDFFRGALFAAVVEYQRRGRRFGTA